MAQSLHCRYRCRCWTHSRRNSNERLSQSKGKSQNAFIRKRILPAPDDRPCRIRAANCFGFVGSWAALQAALGCCLVATGLKPSALGDWAFSPKTGATAPRYQMRPTGFPGSTCLCRIVKLSRFENKHPSFCRRISTDSDSNPQRESSICGA